MFNQPRAKGGSLWPARLLSFDCFSSDAECALLFIYLRDRKSDRRASPLTAALAETTIALSQIVLRASLHWLPWGQTF